LGPLLAAKWGLPFVPIRKQKKLPGELVREEYDLEYGSDVVEI
jgi:adenine phosphoribosyltransferase